MLPIIGLLKLLTRETVWHLQASPRAHGLVSGLVLTIDTYTDAHEPGPRPRPLA
jgi:hypothetical protein